MHIVFEKGNDSRLQATVDVISRSTCNNLSAYRGRITAQMVCMGRLSGGIDTCQVSLYYNLFEIHYSNVKLYYHRVTREALQ